MHKPIKKNLHPIVGNIVIGLIVSTLAGQTLYFVHEYGVNIPFGDDWLWTNIAKNTKSNGFFWQDSHFWLYNASRPIIPSLIIVADIIFGSWNLVYEMYASWILLSISVYLIFLILKNTDNSLRWLIIPAAALMYNVIQFDPLLIGIGIVFFSSTSTTIASLYFLTKVQNNSHAIVIGTIFAVIASFSHILGLLTWIVGLASLLNVKNKRKQFLIIWISSAIVTFSLYFTNYNFGMTKEPHFATLFTADALRFILLFLSNGLVNNAENFQEMVGIILILIITVGSFYLKKFLKVSTEKLIPWIQLGLIGLSSSIISELGRIGVEGPTATRYITYSVFAQIASIVIASIILVEFYRLYKNKKKIFVIASLIFSCLFVLLTIGLFNSYSAGWAGGDQFHRERSLSLTCLTDPGFKLRCPGLFPSQINLNFITGQEKEFVGVLRSYHLGPFANPTYLKEYSSDPLLKSDNWQNMTMTEGLGSIDIIGSDLASSESKIYFNPNESLIEIQGWAMFQNITKSVNAAYIFVDNNASAKISYGLYRGDVATHFGGNTSYYAGWYGIIDVSKLSKGCHHIGSRFVNTHQYFEITTDSQICLK